VITIKEQNLQKICLIISILGIFSLFFISQKLQPKDLEIEQISKQYLNQEIKVNGSITSIKDKISLTLIELSSGSSKIDVVIYKEDIKEIKKGSNIEVVGILNQYNNQLQINAKKITII